MLEKFKGSLRKSDDKKEEIIDGVDEHILSTEDRVRAKIPQLLDVIDANVLQQYQNPEMGWYSSDDDEGHPTYNHWSAGLECLEDKLGRSLTDSELTLYSLSLAYGPVPLLETEEVKTLYAYLWPEGNHRGTVYILETLRSKLSSF